MYLQQEFEEINKLLAHCFLSAFRIGLTTILYLDTSTEGIRYILSQEFPEGQGVNMSRMGSISLSATQTRYSPSELEQMGISWAVQRGGESGSRGVASEVEGWIGGGG